MSYFDGFVQCVVRGEKAVDHLLRAINREITMQFHHGVTGLDGIVAVHLDFVIVLSSSRSREEKQAKSRG
jgi:hypothetical protein